MILNINESMTIEDKLNTLDILCEVNKKMAHDLLDLIKKDIVIETYINENISSLINKKKLLKLLIKKVTNYEEINNINTIILLTKFTEDIMLYLLDYINIHNIYTDPIYKTLAHMFCMYDKDKLLKYLIIKGVNLNIVNNYQETPLIIAHKTKALKCINIIMNIDEINILHSIAKNTKVCTENIINNYQTNKLYSLFKTLISYGFNVNEYVFDNLEKINEDQELFKVIEQLNVNSTLLLITTCITLNYNNLLYLINKNYNLNITFTIDEDNDISGTLLHIAVKNLKKYKRNTENVYNIVNILLKHIDPNITDNNGAIALHYAEENDIIELLLLEYSDCDKQDNLDNTPLHYACINNNFNKIKILLNKNVDINIKNNKNKCAIEYCNDLCLRLFDYHNIDKIKKENQLLKDIFNNFKQLLN